MDVPLTKVDIQNAKNGCYECELLDREIQRQKALGLDVSELELRNEHLRQFFKNLVELYGPLVRKPSRTET